MVFNAPFNNISVSFIGGKKLEYSEKTIDRSQITDKLFHIMLYRVNLRKNFFIVSVILVVRLKFVVR